MWLKNEKLFQYHKIICQRISIIYALMRNCNSFQFLPFINGIKFKKLSLLLKLPGLDLKE